MRISRRNDTPFEGHCFDSTLHAEYDQAWAAKEPRLMASMIPPEFEQFVQHEVACGNYPSAEEVVAEGLRLLREQKLAELRREIDVGIEQLERGEGIVLKDEKALEQFFEDIKQRGRQRLDEKRSKR
jgi:antitoxin ParD1/3/4